MSDIKKIIPQIQNPTTEAFENVEFITSENAVIFEDQKTLKEKVNNLVKKAETSAPDNIITFTETGDAKDSGKKVTDFLTEIPKAKVNSRLFVSDAEKAITDTTPVTDLIFNLLPNTPLLFSYVDPIANIIDKNTKYEVFIPAHAIAWNTHHFEVTWSRGATMIAQGEVTISDGFGSSELIGIPLINTLTQDLSYELGTTLTLKIELTQGEAVEIHSKPGSPITISQNGGNLSTNNVIGIGGDGELATQAQINTEFRTGIAKKVNTEGYVATEESYTTVEKTILASLVESGGKSASYQLIDNSISDIEIQSETFRTTGGGWSTKYFREPFDNIPDLVITPQGNGTVFPEIRNVTAKSFEYIISKLIDGIFITLTTPINMSYIAVEYGGEK